MVESRFAAPSVSFPSEAKAVQQIKPTAKVATIATFPMLGTPDCTEPPTSAAPDGLLSQSLPQLRRGWSRAKGDKWVIEGPEGQNGLCSTRNAIISAPKTVL